MTNPFQNTPTTKLIADQISILAHRKTQAEIASEAGFANANMMTFLKTGKNKVPLDRVPSLAKALEGQIDFAHVADHSAARARLGDLISPGDTVLIKGSNSVGLSQLVTALTNGDY